MTQQAAFFPLTGGMDLVTPAVALPPGRVIAALNYEPVASGYRRLRGFERFSGRTAPSSISDYYLINFTGGDNDVLSIAANTIIGLNAATSTTWAAVAASAAIITSGNPALGTAAGYIPVAFYHDSALASHSSGFLNISFSATVFGSLDGVPQLTGNPNATLLSAARGGLRDVIFSPGTAGNSGAVRGIFGVNGEVVAIRDSVSDPTKADMYRSTTDGWVAVNVGYIYTFNSGGTAEPLPGDFLVRGAFAATIKSVTLTSGSWAAGDAAGTIAVTNNTLTNGNGDLQRGFATIQINVLTVTGGPTQTKLPAGGTYQFISHNFYGASNLTRIYGASGVGKAIEYDPVGQQVVEIATGMAVDRPTKIAEHHGSLFLSFAGGSLQFSVVGNPLAFDAVIGAGEIGVGSEITNLLQVPNALAILAENSISILYGNDSSDYQLEMLTQEAGALPFTAQRLGQGLYMDNRGLRSLSTSQAFGNFSIGAISRLIAPLLEDKRRDSIEPSASLISRTADQYWLFFEDGTGIIAYMGAKQPAILPFNLGIVVTCCCSIEDDGVERIFLGTSTGYVMELNRGTSFDGAAIEHYLRLPFNHFGSPQQLKRFHKVIIDLEASGTTTLSVSAEINYGSEPGIDAQTLSVSTGGGAIDGLGSNELYYASQIETQAEAYLDGVAKDISLKIGGSTTTEEPHILTGITFHVSPRGLRR